jgi:hypothetical protein
VQTADQFARRRATAAVLHALQSEKWAVTRLVEGDNATEIHFELHQPILGVAHTISDSMVTGVTISIATDET